MILIWQQICMLLLLWMHWTRLSISRLVTSHSSGALFTKHAMLEWTVCVAFAFINTMHRCTHNWISKYFHAVYYFQFFPPFSPLFLLLPFFLLLVLFACQYHWALIGADERSSLLFIVCSVHTFSYYHQSLSYCWLLFGTSVNVIVFFFLFHIRSLYAYRRRRPYNAIETSNKAGRAGVNHVCICACGSAAFGFGVAQFIHHCCLVLACMPCWPCVCLFFG